MEYQNLLEQNIYNKRFEGEFLLIGSCVKDIYPEVLETFEKNWKNVFCICLEQFHYTQLMAKLTDIIALGKTKKVGFLTVDGSPHCIQLHYVSKFLKRGLKQDSVEYEHYVIKKGKVFKVGMEAIDKSRDLADIGEEYKI